MNQRVVFSLRKKDILSKAKRAIVCVCFTLLALFCVFQSGYNGYYTSVSMALSDPQVVECSTHRGSIATKNIPNLRDIIKDFLGGGKKEKQAKDNRKIMVYPGGYPLGFTMECEGVVIVAIGSVQTEWGTQKPVEGKNIKVGDVLYSVNGEVVTSSAMLHELLNPQESLGKEVDIEIHRGNQVINEILTPVKEAATSMYRLGLWIRDNAAGVGTLTYIREDNLRFGALGHPVCDIDTGRIMPISGGHIYKCNIVGYNKGLRGNPGELRGLFLRNGAKAGILDNNNKFGVYGVINQEYVDNLGQKPIEVGFRDCVKTGKAKILSTIDGNQPEEYDIEIIKLSYQAKSDKKSMVIKIVDRELIEKTGGIVQGMSGSPIIQNGKLIGAVTHVFVSDPTKGFGVYIDWMIDN